MFQGSLVAIITPMHADGRIDYDSLAGLIEKHIRLGTTGIISLGTTGENVTLTAQEQFDVVKFTIAQVAGRLPVIVGNGGIATHAVIEKTKQFNALAFDAFLTVVPYYNKPTQRGLIAHFEAVAEAANKPVILYNVPGRTVVDMSDETIITLSRHPNICGIKEASGDVSRVAKLKSECAEGFTLLSGDDDTGLDFVKAGGKGVISVTANVAIQSMAKAYEFALAGQWDHAASMHQALLPLHQALFCEPSPVPAKWALDYLDEIESAEVRLPLTSLEPSNEKTIINALDTAGLI
ncbi:4-hydroxy-tetrahydrodipicolinate synthase [Algicola sagamiensis]|uniref:4-hydroxy-tetrahydrodipicolinate synthase n=1 Tax=Algicola sagamiensis TaxID=163869 RepID=UPI0003A03D6F|nr:4-hydroxy-tetrahydrodipicolinate synthase [Algicola sagamiensis]